MLTSAPGPAGSARPVDGLLIDCHTKAVIGWSLAGHMGTDLIRDTIAMAARNVELAPRALFDSTAAPSAANSPSAISTD